MKLTRGIRLQSAFTFIEVTVSLAIVSILFTSLYAGIASGFSLVTLARENLRANQIIVEKMETIRLYNWDQVTSNGFIPPTFTAPFFPVVTNHSLPDEWAESGITYYGTVLVTNPPVDQSYSTNMRLVSVSLNWTNGVPRSRSLQTLVSRDGLQNYVY